MMKYLLLCLSVFASISVNALVVPKASPYDKRVQSVDYNPNDVVEVNTAVGISTQILFGEGETIQDGKAVSGFLDGWELLPQGNSLFIKATAMEGVDAEGKKTVIEPIPGTWNTNILVSTNRRVYVIDLKLHKASSKIAFLVKFNYPEDERLRALAEKAERERKVSMDKTPVVKNSSYKMQIRKRSKNISPSHVFDDGEFTYFTFSGNKDIPAIFHVSENKQESIVNSHIDPKMPGTVVVHKIARQFYLRYGDAVVGVYNEAFDEIGKLNTTGTTVEGVHREVKGQR